MQHVDTDAERGHNLRPDARAEELRRRTDPCPDLGAAEDAAGPVVGGDARHERAPPFGGELAPVAGRGAHLEAPRQAETVGGSGCAGSSDGPPDEGVREAEAQVPGRRVVQPVSARDGRQPRALLVVRDRQRENRARVDRVTP